MTFSVGNRLIAALDAPSRIEADALVERLANVPTWVKIGLELYCAEGPSIVRDYVARGLRVMLDLKLHDIPETVGRATARVAPLGAGLITVHAEGRAMLEAACKAAHPHGAKILAVTVLTSLDDADLAASGVVGSVAETVERRARLAIEAGCDGVVASPHEVARIRAFAPSGFLVVTPGIRPATGGATDDQKRVMTPAQARAAGSDLVVVGRPLRDAADPAAAARAIIAELRVKPERLVYGAGPVAELVKSRPRDVHSIWCDPRRAERASHDPISTIVQAARAAGIHVEDRKRDELDRAVGEGGRHQGVIAWLGAFQYSDLDKLIGGDGPALLVALDGVEDPRNLGAILRSAYLLGAGGVIIPEHRAAEVTPLVSKASAGASETLPIVQMNLARALDELREAGLWRVAVHASAEAQPIASIDGTMPLVLVLGAEGGGVRPLVAKKCDFHAVIPMMRDAVGSFNVSVAAALALYEIRRQRD